MPNLQYSCTHLVVKHGSVISSKSPDLTASIDSTWLINTRLRQYMVYYNCPCNKYVIMPLSVLRILWNIACLILCKTPHHLTEGLISNTRLTSWSEFGVKTCFYMCPWSTKAVLSRWGIFIEIAKNTLYGSKLLIFLLCQKSLGSCSMKIFSKCDTVNISKLNFWLVICIAVNFIWTTLKMIFSIFRFFCTLRFQIYKYCPIITNHTSM